MFVRSFSFLMLSCVVLVGCSNTDGIATVSEPSVTSEDFLVDPEAVINEPIIESGSVLDLPGASEASWTPFFVSNLVDESTQYGAIGQVIVFDDTVKDASFRVVSGDSLELVTNLVYDGVNYNEGIRIISSGESVVEVFGKSSGDVLFSFTVIS